MNIFRGMRNFAITFFLLIIAFAFALLVYNIIFIKSKEIRKAKNRSKNHNHRTILVWNDIEASGLTELSSCSAYKLLRYKEYRGNLNCGAIKCTVTNNRAHLPSVHMYDAILFDIGNEVDKRAKLCFYRTPDQLFVLTTWTKTPMHAVQELESKKGFYNLTMTYRFDSDLVWKRKQIVEIETGFAMDSGTHTYWKQPPLEWEDLSLEEMLVDKKQTAVWLADECESYSKREELVEGLKQYFDVTVYGKCGNGSALENMDFAGVLELNFKFLLAFESYLCEDYITNHVYLALEHSVVPVVFGGANYARFLPPLSYIDAEDFENVESLSKYLLELADDIVQYMRFFWWRDYYKLGAVSPLCDLCERVHKTNSAFKTQTYTDIKKWWLRGCRKESRIQLTNQTVDGGM